MFRLWKKRADAKGDLDKAYAFGEAAAESFSAEVDEFIKVRFDPVFGRYIDVFRNQLQQALRPQDGPPIVVAQIEFDVFCENVDELSEKMTKEIAESCEEWINLFREMGTVDECENYIESKISNFNESLKASGLEVLADYAIPLKDADNLWRADNPELAAKFSAD